MTNNKMTRREDGFTLLELLLVIGVAALLLIGGIATYRLVSDGNKATEATRLLLTLRQEAQVMAQQQGGNYEDIDFDSSVSDPANPLVVSGILRNNQRNPFNGDIVITPTGTGNVNLEVTFGNVTQAACVRLVQAINNPNDVLEVKVGTTTIAADINDFPVTAATAANACSGTASDITWVFP